ncbi:MAG: hypothetical protein R3C17_18985 [Planctomycetaceae bacterium]
MSLKRHTIFRQLAVFWLMILISQCLIAQEKSPIRMKMELLSIRNRSSGPLPVRIRLEYNQPQFLTGDLELQIYDALEVVSSDDLIATLRYEDITLPGADYELNVILPPLRTAVTKNWAVLASFITSDGTIELSSLPDQKGRAEPFDLLTTSPMERGVLVCSCHKETRSQSTSRNRKFLEDRLALDDYNPIYARRNREQASETATGVASEQKVELIGRTIVHFAAQWSSRDLPQDPLSYCAFDIVLLSDEALASLQQEQLDGLTTWVRAGGSVCILPDVPMKPLHLEFLRKLFGPAIGTTADLTLDAEGRLLVVSEESEPVLMSHCGLGRAVLLPAVEDLSVRLSREELGSLVAFLWKVRKDQPVWQGQKWTAADLIRQLKSRGIDVERDAAGIFTRDANFRFNTREQDGKYYFLDLQQLESMYRFNDRLSPEVEPLLSFSEQALMPSDVAMVPTWIIGMILTGYVIAIGPGDYFVLGWLRMRKYTWVLFPVITGVFTLLTVLVAHAFMGSEDTGGKLTITDLADDGVPVRQTTLETLYYSAQANVKSDHKAEFVILSEDNFSNLDFYNQYNPRPQSQDEPLTYTGHFPQNYGISHRVQQWSPVSLRTLTLEPQESRVPPIDWSDTSLVTSSEGQIRLRTTLQNYAAELQQKSATALCTATIFHKEEVVNLLGVHPPPQPQNLNPGYPDPRTYFFDSRFVSAAMLNSIPTAKTLQSNLFGIVCQIAPHGAGSLEDLAFLDSSDPNQWAFVITEQEGENFRVFRKLYWVK